MFGIYNPAWTSVGCEVLSLCVGWCTSWVTSTECSEGQEVSEGTRGGLRGRERAPVRSGFAECDV